MSKVCLFTKRQFEVEILISSNTVRVLFRRVCCNEKYRVVFDEKILLLLGSELLQPVVVI